MIMPMALLFLLGGVQGAIGWIMVKSGLVPEKYFVGHIELTTHLMAAFGLLCYTLWFALSLLIPSSKQIENNYLKRILSVILFVLVLQLIFGGFMAGLRAAVVAPTWPDINGMLIPRSLFVAEFSFIQNITTNPITVHFIHRGLAYLLLVLIFIWWLKSTGFAKNSLPNFFRNILLIIVCLQVALGIMTVLNSTITDRLIWFGVAHQFTGMLLLITVICLLFLVRREKVIR
jgi:heme a synthase